MHDASASGLWPSSRPSHSRSIAWAKRGRNEDIASEIKMQMIEKLKNGYVKAEDLINLIASPRMQKNFSEKGVCKASISKKTATCWLQKLNWRY
jgi:hypothetical protein